MTRSRRTQDLADPKIADSEQMRTQIPRPPPQRGITINEGIQNQERISSHSQNQDAGNQASVINEMNEKISQVLAVVGNLTGRLDRVAPDNTQSRAAISKGKGKLGEPSRVRYTQNTQQTGKRPSEYDEVQSGTSKSRRIPPRRSPPAPTAHSRSLPRDSQRTPAGATGDLRAELDNRRAQRDSQMSWRTDDLRDLLNRNREAARLNVPAADPVQAEPNPPQVSTSKFSAIMAQARFPRKFKHPVLPKYDGRSDPEIHLSSFGLQMDMIDPTEPQRCHLLATTLEGQAHAWFHRLKQGSISSFADFSEKLSMQFCSSKAILRTTESLETIVRRENEGIRSYLERFDKDAREISDLNHGHAISLFFKGLRNPDLGAAIKLQAKGDYHKVIALASLVAESHDASSGVKQQGKREEKKGTTWTKEVGTSPKMKNDNGTERKKFGKPIPRFSNYTPLVAPVKEIAAVVEDKLKKSNNYSDKRMEGDRHCLVHGYGTHSTERCILIKNQIELMIREGKLNDFVDLEAVAQRISEKKKQEQPGPSKRIINTIHGTSGNENHARSLPQSGRSGRREKWPPSSSTRTSCHQRSVPTNPWS